MYKILQKFLFSKFFLLTLTVNAQYSSKNISFKAIDIKDGLSSYTIRKIIQDRYGFTWIGTKDGLNRYDGKTFRVYNKGLKGSDKIVGSDFWDICEDTMRNLIWTITPYNGLNAIDLKNGNVVLGVPTSASNNDFPSIRLRCLNICRDKIWIGTDSGFCVFDANRKIFLPLKNTTQQTKQEKQDKNVNLIFVDRFDRVWVFEKNIGLIVYSGKTLEIIEKHPPSEFYNQYEINSLEFDNSVALDSAHVLISSSVGFKIISYNKNGINSITQEKILDENESKKIEVISLAKDNKGDIWFGTTDNRLFTYDMKTKKLFQVESTINGAKSTFFDYVKSIYFDEKNFLWLGSGKELLFSTNKQPQFIPIYQSSDKKISIDNVFYIYPVNADTFYIGTVNGLYYADPKDISLIDKGKEVWYIRSINVKTYFVSTSNGTFILDEHHKLTRAEIIFPELKNLNDVKINSGVQLGDSAIVFGTQGERGIFVWNFHTHHLYNITSHTFPVALSNNDVNLIYKNANDDILILSDNNIDIFEPKTSTIKRVSWVDSVSNNLYSVFWDVCEAGGYYWIAAYGTGLLQVDKNFHIKQIITVQNGLPTTGIYTVKSLNDSLVFVTSNNGLFLLNTNSFEKKIYFESDGLSSSYNWNIAKWENYIYVGGDKGITIINPSLFRTNPDSPKVFIDQINIETKTNSVNQFNLSFSNYIIPNNFLQATISFSAINYSNPSRTSYAYRIQEIDKNWISLGTQNFVNLIGLSPGTYTLEVKAANEDGVWSKPKMLKLTFLPKWYQTLWFDFLVALVAASLIYSFYRYRLMQLRKQHQIRKEIAGDLHDDIGATLNSVKIFAHLAETSKTKQKYFDNIKEALSYASTGLRDMIWVLDDTGDTVTDLVNRLKMFAHPVAEASGISIRIAEDPSINNITLNKTEKRNLLLIAKEAINNSIKYSGCEKITVTFFREHNKNTLIIEDDGKGFNENEIVRGNGLNNMHDRAKQIHYHISFKSSLGKGTRIVVVHK